MIKFGATLRKSCLLLICLSKFFNLLAQHSGELDPAFNPDDKGMIGASNLVNVVALQADGKMIIGGRFTAYGGESSSGIARLKVDGSFDATFQTGTGFSYQFQYNLVVEALTIQPDGKILVGGDFYSYNGTPAAGLIRLNSNGTVDPSFNTGTGVTGGGLPSVRSIVVQPDNKILIGGYFEEYNENEHAGIVRLNSNGSIDNSFDPGTGALHVDKAVLRTDGKIYIGGYYETYNDVPSYDITLLNSDGTLNAAFSTGTGFDSRAHDIELLPGNKLIVVGDFGSYNGVTANEIIKLNADGTIDNTFNPGAGLANSINNNPFSNDVVLQPDGKIIIGGFFSTTDGNPSGYITRLNSNGSYDNTFSSLPGFNNVVSRIVFDSNNKLIVVGSFTSFNGTSSERIIRLDANGIRDVTFNQNERYHLDPGIAQVEGPVVAMSVQPDGKTIIGGTFTSYKNVARNGLLRLHSDGSLDESFNPALNYFQVLISHVVLQPDGKIVVAGYFGPYHAAGSHKVIRLNADGSLDATFTTGNPDSYGIYSMARQPDGKLLVGGYFSSYNGIAANKLVRISADGNVDPGFNIGSGFDQEIECLTVQPDGKIIAGGSFTSVNGVSKKRIVRLNMDGSVDNTFAVGNGFTDRVFALAVQADGKIIAGGTFASYNGSACTNIARLNTDGSFDAGFNTGSGFDLGVTSMLVQSDKKIIVGGRFTTYQGLPQNGIARLAENGNLDASFDIGAGADGTVYALALQPGYGLIAAGYFYTYNGINRSHIVRIITKKRATLTLDNVHATYGDPDVPVTATSIHNETPIIYTSNDPSIATILNGKIKIHKAGSVTITAVQEESDSYFAATASMTLTIARRAQYITFDPLPGKLVTDGPFELNAFASSTLPVTYSTLNPEIIVITGNIATIVGPGTATVEVGQEGDENYEPADIVQRTITIVNHPPVVVIPVPDQECIESQPFSLTVDEQTFDDLDDESLTYSARLADGSPLPAWLTFDESKLLFEGTPSKDAKSITVRLMAKDKYGSSATVDFEIRIDVVTAIEVSDATRYVYPNPTSGALYIDFEARSICSIIVRSSRGELVLHQKHFSDYAGQSIDLTALPDGLYLAEIQTNEGVLLIKVVKSNLR